MGRIVLLLTEQFINRAIHDNETRKSESVASLDLNFVFIFPMLKSLRAEKNGSTTKIYDCKSLPNQFN